MSAEALHVRSLTKTFGRRGRVVAVDDLTFDVLPGRVTGFLGPNGSGKTTTLRCLLGLVTPSAGSTSIGDRPYSDLTDPVREVGAALEASGFHPGRSARGHLRVIAAAAGIADGRADDVLDLVGLSDSSGRRVAEFSLGMRQRLALAAALLGDPGVLILDEPANGLDPEGIAWLRGFLRALAGEGRTVLISSHVLSEVQQTVDDVVIIRAGRLVRAGTLAELSGSSSGEVVLRSPDAARIAQILQAAGAAVTRRSDGALDVAGMSMAQVGHLAFSNGVELHELTGASGDLERVFLALTSEDAADGPAA